MTSLNPLMTIGNHLKEVLKVHRGMTGAAAESRAVELLDLVRVAGAPRRLREYPHQLSGGMRQRVMVALALAGEPDLLIGDEPTTALDVSIQAQILDLLADVQADLGLAVLLITHDLAVVASLCHRVEVIYAGEIVERGLAERIFTEPFHHYTAGLVRATPQLTARASRLTPITGAPPDLRAVPTGCAFHPRCPAATEICSAEHPVVTEADQSMYACWHPVSTPARAGRT